MLIVGVNSLCMKKRSYFDYNKIDSIVNEVHDTQNKRFDTIRGHIDEGVAPITKFALQSLASITSHNFHKRDILKKGLEERRNRYLQNCQEVSISENNEEILLKNLQDKINDVRAIFAAKILKDQLRKDSFLRDTTNQFAIFDIEPGLWELTSNQVQLAASKIDSLESKIKSRCPIKK